MRIIFLIASLLLLPVAVSVGDQATAKTSTVIAEGAGIDEKTALEDAFRQAVQQVVGVMVDAETLVKNDALVQDKVLTYSGGFIVDYKKLADSKRDGVLRVRIQASVARQTLAHRLETSNITIRKIDGEGIFAEAVTKLEANDSVTEMLSKELENFPYALLDAVHPARPEVSDQNASGATVKFTVTVSPNLERYHAFAQRLDGLLIKAASDNGSFLCKYKYGENQRDPSHGYPAFRPEKFNTGQVYESIVNWIPDAFASEYALHEDRFFAALTTRRSALGDRLTCKYYRLDNQLRGPLVAAARRPVFLNLRLLDKTGEEITSERLGVENRVRRDREFFSGSLTTAFANDGGHANANSWASETSTIVWIHPVHSLARNPVDVWYRTSLDIPVEITLSLEEIKSVSAIACQLVP